MLLRKSVKRSFWVDPLASFNPTRLFAHKTFYKRTKIIGTIGPSSSEPETIAKLVENGLNVCRLNFSHGTHASHLKQVEKIRQGVANDPRPFGIPILVDLKGPSIRSGFLSTPDKKIFLKKRDRLELTTEYSHLGDKNRVACSYHKLLESVDPGDLILMADGTLTLQVEEIKPKDKIVVTQVLNDFWLGEKKNMNLPKKKIDLPTITEKDIVDLKNFVVDYDVDMVSISFCRSASDVEFAREILGVRGIYIF